MTKCEACATQGPLIEALTRDNQRLREQVRILEISAEGLDHTERFQRTRAEKAEARVAELEQELQSVLGDWNALVQAIGAKTNGTAIGEAARLKKRVAELEAALREAASDDHCSACEKRPARCLLCGICGECSARCREHKMETRSESPRSAHNNAHVAGAAPPMKHDAERTCERMLARRRGLRPDLRCGLPAKTIRDGKHVCGRCARILDQRSRSPRDQGATDQATAGASPASDPIGDDALKCPNCGDEARYLTDEDVCDMCHRAMAEEGA